MDWLTLNISNIIEIALELVGAFAVIATMTPNANDNKIADGLLKFLNMLGGNFGNAKNA
jgi:hypothetical protein|tara:strand:- start:1363 stop:1539 length:177 start_codon:yes stop_codon:yes gene_type:complete